MLVVGLIVLTSISLSLHTKSVTDGQGPFDFESRKFNGSWWYGKLAYIWFAVQTAIYLPLIPSVTRGGWIWSIGIAAEAIITFGFVLYAMNRIAKIDQPKNKEMQLWTTYFLLVLFLMNPLNRSTLTTGVPVDKMVDQMTANANRTLIIYGVISGTYFLGTTVFAFKMIRASRALHKNGPSAT